MENDWLNWEVDLSEGSLSQQLFQIIEMTEWVHEYYTYYLEGLDKGIAKDPNLRYTPAKIEIEAQKEEIVRELEIKS